MEVRFFLYYNFGSCNDGSHTGGLEEFATLEEAQKEGERKKKYNMDDGEFQIIEGRKVSCDGNESTQGRLP